MPPTATATSTSPGSGAGASRSSTRRSWMPWMTNARIGGLAHRQLCRSRAAGRIAFAGSYTCEDATVHVEHLAIHKTGRVAREEHDCSDQFFDLSPALRWCAVPQPRVKLLVFDEWSRHICGEVAGAYSVGLDAVLRPFRAHPLDEVLDRAFGGCIRSDSRACQLTLHRSDTDDLAVAAKDHPPRHCLAHYKYTSDVDGYQPVP